MIRAIAVLFLVVGVAPEAIAETRLSGKAIEGGLIFGTTHPEAEVRLGNRKIPVSANGRFVVGFHREADPKTETLSIRAPGKPTEARTFDVEKRDYKIQRIDGLPKKMVTPPKELLERIRREGAEIRAARGQTTNQPLWESDFIWPTKGRISGVYGSQRILNGKPRRPHYGIDIAAPDGTPVVAPANGIVRLAVTDHYYSGGLIILDHGQGLNSAFLHMSKVSVNVGDRVKQGDRLGSVGSTGRSTGPHLDWRINWYERRVDPQLLMKGTLPE